MVGVFPHYGIRKHPVALPGGYLPMCSVLCWEGTAPAQAVPRHHCGKSRQPRKATCTRKEVVTRYKQSFLHKLSFETPSSDLNLAAAALIPGTTGPVAQYQSCYITGGAISTSPSCPLYLRHTWP